MTNNQRGVFEIITAILMLAVLVKMLIVTKVPKSYICKPQKANGYIICEYSY